MSSSLRSALVLTALLAAVPTTRAAAQAAPSAPAPITTPKPGLGLVVEGGFEMGGEKLLELTFTNGDRQSITAGQGGTIAAGLQYRPASAPRLSVAGTVGYKFVTNASENADIKITRVPVELTARWLLSSDWFVGGGVVRHASTRLDGDGFVPNVDLESSTGATIELGWRWIALTYTALSYSVEGSESVNAGSAGLMFRWASTPR